MQAALVTGKAQLELLEVPEPRVEAGKAVVAIAYCGVCGTDVHAYQSGRPYNPAICGHEWTGTVIATGDGVTNVREGDRVVGGVSPACGRCPQCRAGNATACANGMVSITGGPGGRPHGGFAPRIAAMADQLTPVPAALTDIEAALVEPLTVALHAVRRTRIRLGDTVVVIGAGPIGLLTLQCAKAAGAGRVIVIEPHPGRGALALKLGADHVLNPRSDDVAGAILAETGSIGPEVVFECAGISPTINQAVELVRRGGNVTMVGLSEDDAVISPRTWLSKEITFVTSMAYLHEEFAIAMGLIAAKRVDVAALHTATFALDQAHEAFASLATTKEHVKVLIRP